MFLVLAGAVTNKDTIIIELIGIPVAQRKRAKQRCPRQTRGAVFCRFAPPLFFTLRNDYHLVKCGNLSFWKHSLNRNEAILANPKKELEP
jgi:hypothetical protein